MVEVPVCHHPGVSGWTRDDHFLLHTGLVVGLFGARAHILHLVITHFIFLLLIRVFDCSAASKQARVYCHIAPYGPHAVYLSPDMVRAESESPGTCFITNSMSSAGG